MPDTIPCKQPRVPVIHDAHKNLWGAHCQVYGCSWAYGPGLKTDVEEQARRHRRAHRDAVPAAAVDGAPLRGFNARCECGWTSNPGTVTRGDNEDALDYHLRKTHGLVAS